MPEKKSCKNCVFAKWQYSDKGNIRHSVAGKCTYAVIIPQLPVCISGNRMNDFNFHRMGIWAMDGKDCECHKEGNNENRND